MKKYAFLFLFFTSSLFAENNYLHTLIHVGASASLGLATLFCFKETWNNATSAYENYKNSKNTQGLLLGQKDRDKHRRWMKEDIAWGAVWLGATLATGYGTIRIIKNLGKYA